MSVEIRDSPNRPPYTSTGTPFGEIETARIEAVTMNSLLDLRSRLWELCEPVETATGYAKPDYTDAHQVLIKEFVHDVGALYIQTLRALWNDIPLTYKVLDEMWNCFWHALWLRDISPTKYLKVIGLKFAGGGRPPCLRDLFLDIMNLPFREETAALTGCASSEDLKSSLVRKLEGLHNLEEEYRQNALVILQVGIGYVGLLLGFLFFAISCLVTLITFWAS